PVPARRARPRLSRRQRSRSRRPRRLRRAAPAVGRCPPLAIGLRNSIGPVPYPRRLLNDGEEVALDLRPHWWYFSRHILSGIPLLILLVLAFKIDNTVLWWFWAVLALVWAGWLGLQYLNWTFTHFVVTTSRVIFRTGVLAKHGVEIPMDRIANINFHQRIWERIIGAGDLEIESAGRDGQTKFNDVWHPDA